MNHDEDIAVAVSEINRFVQQNQWFDFFVREFTSNRLVIKGGIDLSVAAEILIEFRDVVFVSLLMNWQTDTTGPPLMCLDDDASAPFRIKFQMGSEYPVFSFNAEDYEPGVCVIGARTVAWSLAKAND